MSVSTVKSCVWPFCRKSSTDWNKHDEFSTFFSATKIGERLNDGLNMNQLARLSAMAVGSMACVSIEKYPDGMLSKAFLMTMEDGMQVVAKVPNPNAGRAHFYDS